MNFVEELMKSMGPEITKQLSSNLNMDSGAAAAIIPQVVPMILGGLKRQSQQHGGQQRVDHILNKYGSADVLSNLGDLFSQKKNDSSVDSSLGGLLGNSGMDAEKMISKQFNLDSSIASKIIPMLAPVVLGALTQKRDQGGAGSSGIESLLDQDGDGSILDDVAGFLLGGGRQQQSNSGGGILGSLLGGLFGKK
ncbi:MAG: DUF937 domain-containing protein [Calditrichia bacterium]